MVLLEKIALKLHSTFKLTSCYVPEHNHSILVVKGNGRSASKTLFQEDFIAIGQHVVRGKIKTVILDESIAGSINGASLQWYCMVWRELMHFHGVTNHAFILPYGSTSAQSVEQKSRTNYDSLIKSLEDTGIKIYSNLEEAISTYTN